MDATMVWKQRLSNWACGALTGVVGLTAGSALLGLYRALAAQVRWSWPVSLGSGVLAFLAIDFLSYWHHRAEHHSRWLWAVHAVHHQPNVCDTSVSLRTSMLAPVLVLGLHLSLALAGVPFAVYLPAYLLHTALIFLLHSRTPRWLDRAGRVFNSPYLHRGHHSNHPRLRGKNLGGVLVLWDRLFGTWEPRCDDCTTFGIGAAPAPLHPLTANVQPLVQAWRAGRANPSQRSARGV